MKTRNCFFTREERAFIRKLCALLLFSQDLITTTMIVKGELRPDENWHYTDQ